MVLHVVV